MGFDNIIVVTFCIPSRLISPFCLVVDADWFNRSGKMESISTGIQSAVFFDHVEHGSYPPPGS